MVLVNYTTRELTAKIVYYGPGLCGKTTNLQFIFDSLPPEKKGKMISLATKTDRTLFFDFLPLDLGTIKGMRTRIQLYTVPGQVFYNETRKLVLRGADGIVFVGDSNRNMMDANQESLQNLRENLSEYGIDINEVPLVLQYNKRDLPNIYSVEEMDQTLKMRPEWPSFEAVAIEGTGVHETLKAISKQVLRHLANKFSAGAAERPLAASAPAQTAAPPREAKPQAPPKIELPAEAAPAEIELEPPSPGEEVTIGGEMDDATYASYYGGSGPDEEAVPVESKSPEAVSIGGDLADEDYAAFYGGSGAAEADEAVSWREKEEEETITLDTEGGAGSDAFGGGSSAGAGGEFQEWMGGGADQEESIRLEEDDAFILEAESPPAAPARGPEIRAEAPLVVPIPLELVGGQGEITRSVVVPIEFQSPTGSQVFELRLQLVLKPSKG